MEQLRAIWSKLKRSSPQLESETVYQPNPETVYPRLSLPGLPRELVQLIASFLPPSSKALLALTCKQILCVIGTDPWAYLRQDRFEHATFDLILRGSYPNSCSLKTRSRAVTTWSRPSVPMAYTDYGHPLCFRPDPSRFEYTVEWVHVLLALKGRIQLDKFAYTGSNSLTCQMHTAKVRMQVVPRIVSGSLLLKCSYTIQFPTDAPFPGLSVLGDASPGFEICKHVSTTRRAYPWYDNGLVDEIAPIRDFRTFCRRCSCGDEDDDLDDPHEAFSNAVESTILCTRLHQCSYCFTEYKIFVDSEQGTLIINAWHNLGSGTTSGPDQRPACLKWLSLGGEGGRGGCTVQTFPLGSLEYAFDTGGGSKLLEGSPS